MIRIVQVRACSLTELVTSILGSIAGSESDQQRELSS